MWWPSDRCVAQFVKRDAFGVLFACIVCGLQMLSKRILVAVVAVGLLCACVADDASTEAEEEPQYAQVVFYKGIDLDGEYMVVGKNFTVKYSLYNVGTKYVTWRLASLFVGVDCRYGILAALFHYLRVY